MRHCAPPKPSGTAFPNTCDFLLKCIRDLQHHTHALLAAILFKICTFVLPIQARLSSFPKSSTFQVSCESMAYKQLSRWCRTSCLCAANVHANQAAGSGYGMRCRTDTGLQASLETSVYLHQSQNPLSYRKAWLKS